MPNPAIEFQDVIKVYQGRFSQQRITALANISFAVAPGEVCAFLGPNGAGKTTSIGLLMGFLFADSGEIRVLDCPPGDIRAKRQIGFLPENFAFYKYLTAPELLRLHLALSDEPRTGEQNLIADLITKVKLQGYEQLKIGKYSRGMMQRLGLAQALLTNPQLLVLDEPTSGLDPAGRHDVLELLATLKAEGKTIFLSSHILPEVEQICDRVIIIDRGRLLRAGSLRELLESANRVEIVAHRLDEELERTLVEHGASIEQTPDQARIVIDASRKREAVELIWSAGFDVIAMNPLKSTLEEFFLKMVADGGGA